MSQVSSKSLSKDTEEKLFSIFFSSFAKLSNSSDIQKFLFDLLSPTERTMLAKRLAIAYLLTKGYQYDTIKDTINVSQGTIARINFILTYQGRGYSVVLNQIFLDEKLQKILQKIEDTAIAILPLSGLKKGMEKDRKERRSKNSHPTLG